MTVLATTHPTLLDLARRLGPDGGIDTIIEILAEQNPIIQDAVFIEGNLPTGHRTTVRTGYPEPTWRKLYGGVQPTKSTTVQVTDATGMLEAYAEVDKALADLNGNTAAFRLSEDRAHIEGMSQEMAGTMFYGSAAVPEEFVGLTPRYNSLTASTAQSADNVIDAGGASTDNTSIWLISWGPNSIHGIYPKGSKAGLAVTDKGQVTIESIDGAGGRMEAYRTHYRWDAGLTVRDWRSAVRIANIDISDLATLSNTALLINYMVQASERLVVNGGRPVWYANRTVRTALRQGILEKISNNLTWDTVAGRTVMTFDGYEVHRSDALLNNEDEVVA